jgi:hypothetical protein
MGGQLNVLEVVQTDDINDEILLIKKISAILELKRSSERIIILVCEAIDDGKIGQDDYHEEKDNENQEP